MDSIENMIDQFLSDWMKSEEAIKLDWENMSLETEERSMELTKAFFEHLMKMYPDEAWHLADREEMLSKIWFAIDKIFENPEVWGATYSEDDAEKIEAYIYNRKVYRKGIEYQIGRNLTDLEWVDFAAEFEKVLDEAGNAVLDSFEERLTRKSDTI